MKPKIKGLLIDKEQKTYKIRELEISITSKCHLRCDNCGFCIPEQPSPSLSKNIVEEFAESLNLLERLNIQVGSLGILGGEPTFNKTKLDEGLIAFSKFKNVERIEVVSHGLTPQNLNKSSLKYIDKLSLSIYFENKELIELWKNYLDRFAPHIELSLRKDKEWDKWQGNEVADDTKAQEMFDYCWYRKHCVTLERKRLFMCSRIPKLPRDKEGLLLGESTSLEDVINYLNQETFTESCKTCTPMMGLEKVKAGVQPDDRISKLIPRAIEFLRNELK